jgi:uncharacterized protein YjbJ (UPF0337 family)
MSWEIIEGNWTHFRAQVKAQWVDLNEEHLDSVGGKRERLIGAIQENYGVSQVEAEEQVKEWEDRNKDVFAETAAAIRKLPRSLHGATE